MSVRAFLIYTYFLISNGDQKNGLELHILSDSPDWVTHIEGGEAAGNVLTALIIIR